MHGLNVMDIEVEQKLISSRFLGREVLVDFYLPRNVADPGSMNLLLINDGQNLEELGLEPMLTSLNAQGRLLPLLCVGIHTGKDRKMEYGVASRPDYAGRGARASDYTRFVTEELLPHIRLEYALPVFREIAFAGFSLGGLSALDICWNHPELFHRVGVFSGSHWWRSVAQDDPSYRDDKHRIIHQEIRSGAYKPGMRFFFQTGALDETSDRNGNGIIDSIDDTQDLIGELKQKGYRMPEDVVYLELPEGHHDIPTWGQAMPFFLQWAWGV